MSEFKNKTVLITGATGLIGSHIVEEFLSYGDVFVVACSRSEKKIKEVFFNCIDNEKFSYYVCDVCEGLNITTNIDYIFHAAGPIGGNTIRERPLDVIFPNINGLINCLDFLLRQKSSTGVSGRLVLLSSMTVYGNISDKNISVSEKMTYLAENLDSMLSPYSESKRMSEVIALSYARQFEIEVVISRLSVVYGACLYLPNTAIFDFIKKGISGENIIINSEYLPKRDYIYIEDAISGILTVAVRGENMEAYNISSNGELENLASIDEIATLIANFVNIKCKNHSQVLFRHKLNDTAKEKGFRLNNDKLKSLGWKLKYSLSAGVLITLDNVIKFYSKKLSE